MPQEKNAKNILIWCLSTYVGICINDRTAPANYQIIKYMRLKMNKHFVPCSQCAFKQFKSLVAEIQSVDI